MKKIAIIPLGWLGLALFNKLNKMDVEVSGSYFNTSKELENEFQFDINANIIPPYLSECDIVIIAIPPSKIFNQNKFRDFLSKISNKKIIFISSTSVYGNQGIVTELTTARPETENGKILLKWEEFIQKNFKSFEIIRSAGQYGGQRHPGKFLSGKVDIQGADDRINLIEQSDLIDIIIKSISSTKNHIINAVSTDHQIKKEFYTKYCILNKLPLPHFSNAVDISNKIVTTIHSEYEVTTPLS